MTNFRFQKFSVSLNLVNLAAKMDFSPYIAELLYTYDCVIIPQFGGFVANYKPAHIHPVSHKIYPPSKQIGFNKNLQQNDGLLANKIARQEHISYAQALELISQWRKEIEKQLTENGFFTFDKIGTLKKTAENTLHFDADTKENFFPGAFGLTPVVAQPAIEPKIVPIVKPAKTNAKFIRRVAAIFIGGMITSYFLFNYDDVAQQTTQLASFFKGEKAHYSPQNNTFDFSEKNIDVSIDSSGQTAYLKMEGRTPIVIANKVSKQDSTMVSVTTPELRFHIIAGCFTKKSNAKKLAKELKKQGFDPKIIDSYKNYYTVIIKSFATKEQAKSFLPQTKPLIAHSWVLEWNV